MTKNRLKLKKKIKSNIKKVYFSGFCLTDNKNFALFNVSDQFLVDNEFSNALNFKLTEDDLWIIINRSNEIKPIKENQDVFFKNHGTVKKEFFDLINNFHKCKFFPITEWFGKKCNRLIVALPDKEGKPIGILKTIVKNVEKEKPHGT